MERNKNVLNILVDVVVSIFTVIGMQFWSNGKQGRDD